MRRQGVLMPIFSLPSPYGIGTFGKESYRFVDFLRAAGQKLWQILPLGPTGYGASPYQSFSTFAGNSYLIDLELLVEEGYLTKEQCDSLDFGEDLNQIDYEKLYIARDAVLRLAFAKAVELEVEETVRYQRFLEKNAEWLEDFALFMALKGTFGGKCFLEWDEEIRFRKKEALDHYRQELSCEIRYYEFVQFLFFTQWRALKEYANEAGIEIVGDIPIYVAFDSADTWACPDLFLLDEDGNPKGVAGCPPDAFSSTGQLWGNPLYDWKYHRFTGFEWWIRRMAHCYELYDVVRIDHFRGFDEYWFVPYGDETAQNGHWEEGPGLELFEAIEEKLGKKQVIAEDLGFLTESVIKLVKDCNFPGMKILQFAFAPWQNSVYLPFLHIQNCVVYTGTHDNETTLGFIQSRNEEERAFLEEYLGCKGEKELLWALIRAAMGSVSDTSIIPMQDFLELGNEARINTPSTFGENWKWRMDKEALTTELADRIHYLTRMYGRI